MRSLVPLLSLLSAAPILATGCDDGFVGGSDDGGAPGGAGGPGADADPGCPSIRVDLSPVVPTVLLLLDQSGSMTAAFGNTNRWEAMKKALVDPTSGVVKQLEGQVVFGASLYTSHDGNSGGTCPIMTNVPPAAQNYVAIEDLLAGHAPDDETPTGASIMVAKGLLQAVPNDPDKPPSPRIIVLATDGEPDTCAVPNPQNGQADAIAAAKAAHADGIRLFILSVGNEVGAQHQQQMANAGAGLAVDGSQGNAPYYNAADPAALRAAFETIINGVRECTFALDGAVDPATACSGTVTLDGMVLPCNGADGWHLVDDRTLKLDGAACETFLGDPTVSFTADFPCGAIIE
jgi:hypothetical protein